MITDAHQQLQLQKRVVTSSHNKTITDQLSYAPTGLNVNAEDISHLLYSPIIGDIKRCKQKLRQRQQEQYQQRLQQQHIKPLLLKAVRKSSMH